MFLEQANRISERLISRFNYAFSGLVLVGGRQHGNVAAYFRVARYPGVTVIDSHKPTYRDEFAPVVKIS
jgi:hypothetical protein